MSKCCKCGKTKKLNVQNASTNDSQYEYFRGTSKMMSDLSHTQFVEGYEVSFKKLGKSLIVSDGVWEQNTNERIIKMKKLLPNSNVKLECETDSIERFVDFLDPYYWGLSAGAKSPIFY